MKAYSALKEKLATVVDLRNAASVLGWDQQTYMPPGGAQARSDQLATLEKLAHEHFTAPEVGDLLARAAEEVARFDQDSDERSLVRVVRRDYNKALKVPSTLVAEIARTSSMAMESWVRARAESSFPLFQPDLEKVFHLQRELARCLGFEECIYDALLDQYEPGAKASELRRVFGELKEGLVPLVQAISERLSRVDDSVLHRSYAEARQWEFGVEILKRFGYDLSRGRQDKSVHPFTTSFSRHDVRITTRVDERFFPTALFGTLHECGHALYEQGVSESLERTLLAGAASLGVHESQSRLWENLVGRSRPFWRFFYPRLQSLFPDCLGNVPLEDFYRAINRVEPSLIRVEADEITYNLHVLLRFELEIAVLEEVISVADLPAAWNARMESYLGVVPRNDSEGVLQDVHWSNGLVGYFPTYSLGNVISVQLFEKAQSDSPEIRSQMDEGRFTALLEWLRKHIHVYGRKRLPHELLQRATGETLQVGPYLNYLRSKYSEIYSL
ncbi:MAG: carboxypeptidase M32 [Acidobacteriota bacterium]